MPSLLPPIEEREWIIDELARLGRQTGWDPLVCAPLLLPEPRYFPDRWTPDADGVWRLARRLQIYAGLERLGASIEVFEQLQELAPAGVLHQGAVHHQGAAALFAGIRDGVCLFGIELGRLEDGPGVTAAMAHEVAHAFRAHHGIALADPEQLDVEERLTDLTTIYLGSGVLTTNATARHRSETADGSLFGHRWSFSSLGYISPEAMSFALAVVAVARGLGRLERRAIVDALETNQAASFKHAVSWLEREQPNLRSRLGVPEDPNDWPEPWSLDELTAPLDEPATADDRDEEEPEEEVGPWNAGFPVFRLRPGYQKGDNLLAGLVGFAVGLALGWIDPFLGGVAALGGGWGSRELIRLFGSDHCSDRECAVQLPKTASICPNCGGSIVGEIRRMDERLDAEERYLEAYDETADVRRRPLADRAERR